MDVWKKVLCGVAAPILALTLPLTASAQGFIRDAEIALEDGGELLYVGVVVPARHRDEGRSPAPRSIAHILIVEIDVQKS